MRCRSNVHVRARLPSIAGWIILALAPAASPAAAPTEEAQTNVFDDPFLQVTDAIPDCPRQEAPRITPSEMRAEAHSRAERGTRCYQSGQCRLPNAYLYDREIVPRAKAAILYDGRFSGTSIWVLGQRRWVWLKGCVRTPEQSAAAEKLVRSIDDVETVINELVVRKR